MRRETSLTHRGLIRQDKDQRWFEAVPGERIAIRIRSDEVAGAYALVEGILSPAGGPPLHVHENEDEIIEVLEGSLRMVCNGENLEVSAGGVVVIPKGTSHTWKNEMPTPVRARAFLIPGGAEGMFEAFVGRPAEELAEIAGRFGCRFIGPPL